MSPISIEDRIIKTLEKALASSQVDKVSRTGRILSPYYAKRLHELLAEYSAQTESVKEAS